MGKKTQEAKKAAAMAMALRTLDRTFAPRRAGRRITQDEVARLARKPHRCGWPS